MMYTLCTCTTELERKKAELQGASSIVLNTPPLICHSFGWKACCLTCCLTCAIVHTFETTKEVD